MVERIAEKLNQMNPTYDQIGASINQCSSHTKSIDLGEKKRSRLVTYAEKC